MTKRRQIKETIKKAEPRDARCDKRIMIITIINDFNNKRRFRPALKCWENFLTLNI